MPRVVSLAMFASLPYLVSGCLSEADPCDGVTCPDDRICISLQRGTSCECADPTVEVDGECVEEGAEGEGE